MSEIIENPIALINTLQARIANLEAKLVAQSEYAREANQDVIATGIRGLRLHGVIPLFIGNGDMESMQDEVERISPDLIKAFREVWPIETSVLSEATKKEIRDKAKNGMCRWL